MLQIFTYSTGLALTGRSAACAPATATMPAAEPRRRLFTIFIVTSKVLMGGFRLARVPRHPRFPDPLETTRNSFSHPDLAAHLAIRKGRTGRPGDAPLRRAPTFS